MNVDSTGPQCREIPIADRGRVVAASGPSPVRYERATRSPLAEPGDVRARRSGSSTDVLGAFVPHLAAARACGARSALDGHVRDGRDRLRPAHPASEARSRGAGGLPDGRQRLPAGDAANELGQGIIAARRPWLAMRIARALICPKDHTSPKVDPLRALRWQGGTPVPRPYRHASRYVDSRRARSDGRDRHFIGRLQQSAGMRRSAGSDGWTAAHSGDGIVLPERLCRLITPRSPVLPRREPIYSSEVGQAVDPQQPNADDHELLWVVRARHPSLSSGTS